MSSSKGRLPLEHLRAVVLTQAWAGTYTTRLLADMGAEVIQIEALDRPDPWRGGYPPRLSGTYPDNIPGERPFDRNAAYNSVNTGKRAITLDFNHQEAKDMFLDLVGISDIIAENFSARVMPNFGMGYDVLSEVNPSIVMLRMPSYGCTGPYSAYMGNGGTTEPMSGIASALGYPDGPPMNSGFMHTDPYAGYVACGAILIALHHRSRTGKGQVVDLSQQETSIGLMAEHVIEYSMSGRLPARNANADISMAPHGNYPCDGDDSWVAISVRNDGEWVRLCQVMELPGMANDPNYATAAGRVQSASQLDVIVAKWTLTRTAVGVTELLQAQGIPASPVMKARELLGNPHLEERGFFQELDHPDTGRQTYAGVAWRLSKTPGRLLGPSPRLGQHSAEVLQGLLGLPSSHVQRLVDAGITGDTPNLND